MCAAVRGTSDYDLYRNPMSWEVRKRKGSYIMRFICGKKINNKIFVRTKKGNWIEFTLLFVE